MMNTALQQQLILQADGRYLSDPELQPLQQYLGSFPLRFNTYRLLQEHSQTLVLQTLRKTIQAHRKTIQEHGAKCQRDMSYTLECLARSVLLDDAQGFREGYVLWMQNITRALHKESSAIDAYRILQEEVSATFPKDSAQLVNQYLAALIEGLSAY